MPEQNHKHVVFHIFFFIAIYNIAALNDLSNGKGWNVFSSILSIFMSLTVYHNSLQAILSFLFLFLRFWPACELWHHSVKFFTHLQWKLSLLCSLYSLHRTWNNGWRSICIWKVSSCSNNQVVSGCWPVNYVVSKECIVIPTWVFSRHDDAAEL